jgi:ADP-heptose:LPS heptosyltransferase
MNSTPAKTFSHAGDIGDIIYSMPAMRAMGGGSLILHPANYTRQRMTQQVADSLRPLLEAQNYVRAVRFSQIPEGFALDGWREYTFPLIYNLADRVLDMAGLPHAERDLPWIAAEPNRVASVVIHRSLRYRNPRFSWPRILDRYSGKIVFIGLQNEHEDFEKNFGHIDYYPTANFLDLARVIAGADLFIGNQSSPLSLAVAMQKPFVLEQSPAAENWNCHFERPNAVYVLRGHELLRHLQQDL